MTASCSLNRLAVFQKGSFPFFIARLSGNIRATIRSPVPARREKARPYRFPEYIIETPPQQSVFQKIKSKGEGSVAI